MNNVHKDHVMCLEHGEWVAYKSKRYKNLGSASSARPEDGKAPIDIERIPLGTASWEEARERLNRRLKPKKKPKYDPDYPQQTRIS